MIHRSPAAKDARISRARVPAEPEALAGWPSGAVNTWILVGGKARDEIHSLHEFLAASLFAGGAMTVLALGGGWFLATRALRPIARISEAASTITARDLTRRIDVAHTESELGRLARTLNETFDRLQTGFDQQARFTADASHELRTPLSLVLSQAELALMKEQSAEEYRVALQSVNRAALRMKAVVEGLPHARPGGRGQLTLAKEPVALAALVRDRPMLGLAARRKVAVTVHAQPATVSGDRDRLRDAVSNLISTPSATRPRAGARTSRSPRKAPTRSSRWPTRASGFPRRTAPTSSSGSIGWTRRGRATRAGAASAWRSRSG